MERLADLYTLLGNDAYADALNPTIGFGTTWGEAAPGMMQIDYGTASPGLFCFDNQVPSLLDEELALSRQRDAKPEEWEAYNAYCEECKAEAKAEVYGK